MPLQQVTNSARLNNKQNTSQVEPQSPYQKSPVKPSFQNGFTKASPHKKSLSSQMTQLKIRLSDRQFQLKKLEEDCAVKLAMMQKQLIKQKNEKKSIIKQSKEKLEEDRQYFQTKIKLLEQGWKNKEKEIEQKIRNQTLLISQKEFVLLTQKFQTDFKIKNEEVQKVKEQFNRQKQRLINAYKGKLTQAEISKQSLIQQMIQKNEQQILQLRQQHLSEVQFYHQTEGEKVKQNNVVVKILSDKIRATEEQLRNVKEKVKLLTKQIQSKQEELTLERRAKQQYRLDKVYLERKVGRLEPDIKDQYEKQLQAVKISYQSSLEQVKKSSLKQVSDLKSLHKQSTQNYQDQLSQMQERCRQVSFLHQTIKSNEDDLKKIQMLQMKLIKKQMELDKQRQDVKMCKLELSNMDQIFHKMFEEAKLKSLRPKRHRLPSLLSVGQNRSTMDVYNNNVTEQVKQKKKFSIREINYPALNKSKDVRQLSSEFTPYQ